MFSRVSEQLHEVSMSLMFSPIDKRVEECIFIELIRYNMFLNSLTYPWKILWLVLWVCLRKAVWLLVLWQTRNSYWVRAAWFPQWKGPKWVHRSMTAAKSTEGQWTLSAEDTGPRQKVATVLAGTDGDIFQKVFFSATVTLLLLKGAGERLYQDQGNKCFWLCNYRF